MAFLPPEQQNQQTPQGTTTTGAPASGGPPPQSGGSAGGGTAPAKAGTATGTPTQFGSSASKLGDYLTANAPQIQNQANGVANQLNTAYGQISGDVTNAANQFGQSVQAGYTAPDSGLVDQAAANPTGFASTPSNVAGFQAQYNDTYTGPQNYESTTPYSNIQNEVTNAVQNAGQFNTQAGLQNYFAGQGGNQTQASNTLDSLLLQGNPGAQQTIQNAAGQYNQLTPQFQTSVTNADALVPAAQQAAQQASQYAQNTFAPVVSNFQTGLNTNLTNVNNQRNTYNQNVTQNQQAAIAAQQALNNQEPGYLQQALSETGNLGNPTTDAQEAAQIQALFGGNQTALNALAPYLSGQPITQPGTLANVSNTGNYQEDNALAQLLGSNYNPSLNQANIGQAGSYTVPGLPGALPNTGQQLQYEGDLAALYGNANNPYNTFANYQTATPQQLAAEISKNAGTAGGQYGPGLNPADLAALQRLSAGEQGFQG